MINTHISKTSIHFSVIYANFFFFCLDKTFAKTVSFFDTEALVTVLFFINLADNMCILLEHYFFYWYIFFILFQVKRKKKSSMRLSWHFESTVNRRFLQKQLRLFYCWPTWSYDVMSLWTFTLKTFADLCKLFFFPQQKEKIKGLLFVVNWIQSIKKTLKDLLAEVCS